MFFSHALSPSKKREVHSRRAYDSLLYSGEWMSRETKKLNRREDGNGWKHKRKRGKKNEKRFEEEQLAEVFFNIYLFSLVWFFRVPTCLWFLYNPCGKFLVFSRAFHEWMISRVYHCWRWWRRIEHNISRLFKWLHVRAVKFQGALGDFQRHD